MASSRKAKRKEPEHPQAPTNEEYAVAKFLRFNVPTREGNLPGVGDVSCFYADDAINALLDSKWAKSKNGPITDRKSGVEYCKRLLHHGLFVRAKLAKKPDKPLRAAGKPAAAAVAAGDARDSGNESSRKGKVATANRSCDSGAESAKEQQAPPSSRKAKKAAAGKKDEDKEEAAAGKDAAAGAKKKLKKLKLEVHEGLPFVDGREICVWVYDPTSFKTFAGGLLLILGAIAFCLYPLWPQEMRGGIYYLSMAAIGLLGVLLLISILRHVLFVGVWALTAGKCHLWVLPNLWQDCGLLESFKPFYTLESVSASTSAVDDQTQGSSEEVCAGDGHQQPPAEGEADADSGEVDPPSSGDENGGASPEPRDAGGRSAAEESSGGDENDDQGFEMIDAAAAAADDVGAGQ